MYYLAKTVARKECGIRSTTASSVVDLMPKLPVISSSHDAETEVAQFLACPPRSDNRRKLIRKLVNDGDYNHNFDVLKGKKGELIIYRRPSSDNVAVANDYVPCDLCFAFFKKRDLWKHRKNCPFLVKENDDRGSGRRLQSRCAMLMPVSNDVCDGLKKILSKMNNDEISQLIRRDSVIMRFESRLYAKDSHLAHRHY
jgi:hypothetical protein